MDPWPAGYARVELQEIDSTNAEAARRVQDLTGPTWILAHRQTAGRGRRGRAWADPAGNFSATLVQRPGGPPEQVALRSFVASLALFDAFVAATGRANSFSLKWPNDVLLNGGKVAGILLESVGNSVSVSHLAIGIGVNLANTPTGPQVEARAVPPVSLLSETGSVVTPSEFLDLLAPAYARHEQRFSTYGFAPIREAWMQRAAKVGEVITARTATEEFTGTFEAVDETGNLILKTAQSRRAIAAADVFF
ncbi:biotin--[acetyl-CoA-carboxylase] ligase [Actibacterium lipolyticum]|uniref:biotin--[acetyl-CoA-carboxylase] ligase n=1 Tax=Actibacterium lipolyticum TaxID=1524263 RepID=UPI000BB454EC|nr:biotin--[acetyl-CoA-carboxylase] ligase [Actibacterium lipolyticum]